MKVSYYGPTSSVHLPFGVRSNPSPRTDQLTSPSSVKPPPILTSSPVDMRIDPHVRRTHGVHFGWISIGLNSDGVHCIQNDSTKISKIIKGQESNRHIVLNHQPKASSSTPRRNHAIAYISQHSRVQTLLDYPATCSSHHQKLSLPFQ